MLTAAVKLAEKPGGLGNLQRGAVAKRVGCSASLINHYFDNMDGLRQAVIKQCVVDKNLSVVGQALLARNRAVRNIDADLKKQAIAHATNI
jgi:AcrR family transcriptional regulator